MPTRSAEVILMRKQIRITGFGGQGIITAGIILAKSAVTDGFFATQTQAYGSQSRGGASKADVIISESEIYDFVIETPDVLVALSQVGFEKYLKTTGKHTLLILDSRISPTDLPPHVNSHVYPFVDLAEMKLGHGIYAGPIMLGVLSSILGFPSLKTLKEEYRNRFPKNPDKNLKALEMGFDLPVS